MNKIYWDKDKISILTDQIDVAAHKHWALQLNKLALSQSRLSHLFREQVIKKLYSISSMQKAFLALLSGKSITEAAMLANFDMPSHFAAVTKRMMGMTASVSLKNSVFLKVNDI